MKRQEIDHILVKMLDSHREVSDLNFTVGKPMQVESAGELVPVEIRGHTKPLTAFQTEVIALNLVNQDRRLTETLLRTGSCDLSYALPGKAVLPFENDPVLQILVRDIKETEVPENVPPGAESARAYSKKAMLQRSQDFAASSQTYLVTCRLQWDAVESGEPGATLEDLNWYMASYASAIAGKLSQVNRDYASARPYYLAFFALVQEEDPLWGGMRGLINPMLAYFWSNAGRELDINVSTWNLSMASPAQIAVYAATHPNSELRKFWQKITTELAKVNPGLLHRIANQLMLSRAENPEHGKVAEQMEEILSMASMA